MLPKKWSLVLSTERSKAASLSMLIPSVPSYGSLIDVRPIREQHLEGKELEFKVIKLDQKRNNVVVSRRAVMEATAPSAMNCSKPPRRSERQGRS